MSRTPSPRLFELVKSLTPSEKRYFVLFAERHVLGQGNKYLQLFYAVSAQTEYDAEALRHELYPEDMADTNAFSELSTYLYELILRGLRAFNEGKSARMRIKSLLQNVEILYNKSLFKQCRAMLERAHKLATRYEEFGILIEVLNWYKRIAYAESDIPYIEANIERIHEEERSVLGKQQELAGYWSLFYQMLVRVRKDAVLRSEERLENLRKLLGNPLLEKDRRPESIQASMLYLRINSLGAYSQGDLENFYLLNRQLLEQSSGMRHLFEEDPTQLISILTNLVAACNYLDRYAEMDDYLERFKAIQPVSRDDEEKIVNQYYLNKMFFCLKTGDFEQGIALAKQCEHLRETYGRTLFGTSFYSFYAYLYFASGRYDDALTWLNAVLDAPGEREDLQCVARVLILLSHYALGNFLLVDHLLRSTERYLRRGARLYVFERAILRFVRQSAAFPDKKTEREALQKLRSELAELLADPQEKVLLNYFNFVAWIDSRLSGKSMKVVLTEKQDT